MAKKNKPTTLYEHFTSQGQSLPSVSERRSTYNLPDSYTGTKEQNISLLKAIQNPKKSYQANLTKHISTQPKSDFVSKVGNNKITMGENTSNIMNADKKPSERTVKAHF